MKNASFLVAAISSGAALLSVQAAFSDNPAAEVGIKQNVSAAVQVGRRANNPSENPSVSADGRYVAFQSAATNLDPRDNTGRQDIFVRDTVKGTTELISIAPDGSPGNDYSVHPTISDDGRFVAFHSQASNLVAGDENNNIDVFVRDRKSGTTVLASVSSDNAQGNNLSIEPRISGNGKFVAFVSAATNLIPDDTNGNRDIFVRDLEKGVTEAVSVSNEGVLGSHKSVKPSISDDGRFVAFESPSQNLVAIDNKKSNETEWNYIDIFVHDRETGKTEIVSLNLEGKPANNISVNSIISGDGRYVTFQSRAQDLVKDYPQDKLEEVYARGYRATRTDIYVRDRKLGKTELVSMTRSGQPGNHYSFEPAISADGSVVVFGSGAKDLVNAKTSDVNVFVRDMKKKQTEVLSVFRDQKIGGTNCIHPVISKDGSTAVFQCNYGRADKARSDIYIRKVNSDDSQIASVSSGASPTDDYWATLSD